MSIEEQVSKSIIAAAEGVIVASGRSCPPLTLSTPLISESTGLDSLNGLEILTEVEILFDIECSEKLLIPSSDGRPLTIREVAQRITKIIGSGDAQG